MISRYPKKIPQMTALKPAVRVMRSRIWPDKSHRSQTPPLKSVTGEPSYARYECGHCLYDLCGPLNFGE